MNLYQLISRIESADNQWATRYEPHVHDRAKAGKYASQVKAAAKANQCSRDTARVIIATSWGLYQIMGFNLYGVLGWKQSVGEFMAHDHGQEQIFHKYCLLSNIWKDGDINAGDEDWLFKFAKAYNGPGAPTAYVAKMKEHLK
jgi:hypothetical protein